MKTVIRNQNDDNLYSSRPFNKTTKLICPEKLVIKSRSFTEKSKILFFAKFKVLNMRNPKQFH